MSEKEPKRLPYYVAGYDSYGGGYVVRFDRDRGDVEVARFIDELEAIQYAKYRNAMLIKYDTTDVRVYDINTRPAPSTLLDAEKVKNLVQCVPTESGIPRPVTKDFLEGIQYLQNMILKAINSGNLGAEGNE